MARIKKIMQEDEEIGKLSSTVTVMVSKAVELFIKSLLNAALEIYREDIAKDNKNQKHIKDTHLKISIDRNERFDFLRNMSDKNKTKKVETKEKKRTPSKNTKNSKDLVNSLTGNDLPGIESNPSFTSNVPKASVMHAKLGDEDDDYDEC